MHRSEHPKPQFQRESWLNLNGTWSFAFDFGQSGEEKGWAADPSALDMQIEVPFCPESRLSGVAHTDFMPAVWYSRTFKVPDEWRGQRVFLNFGAVDYDCRAWVNGILVGRHYGGSSSFSFEITQALNDGDNLLVVSATDDTRSHIQPLGKQSSLYHSHGCAYTRTTGIWQTVWLEARPRCYLDSARIVPDLDGERFVLTPVVQGMRRGMAFRAVLVSEGKAVASVESAASGVPVELDVPDPRPWSPSDPYLYELKLELIENGRGIDLVHSYAGLRKFHIEGNRFFLNNKPIFLRFVLDQGYNPEGIWTAPSDEELRADIERSMAVGFNGARLHQKVFEERFHHWADRLGYLTWAEFPDWGIDFAKPQALLNHHREWREVVMRDLNHPSIVAWTPFNETMGAAQSVTEVHRRALSEVVELTHQLDPTRPVNDASGYVHVETDIYTLHDYEQDPEAFGKKYATASSEPGANAELLRSKLDAPYAGQPLVVDEYGGTWWREEAPTEGQGSWGYGNRPKSIDEVYARIEGLTAVLTGNPNIAGFTYTQLTDVEQEQNGIYTYERKLKFDAQRLKKAFQAPAAIEAE